MRSIFAVYKRELALYFRSPIAYAIAFVVLLLLGILFVANVDAAINANLQSQQFGGGQSVPLTLLLNSPALLTFLMFLVGPLLTMRLIAEESREGTLEMLMTLPMNESSFIIGKFLASWTFYTFLLLLTLGEVILGRQIGVPDYGVISTAYLGSWLYGGAALAICMIWSAVTEEQIVAAFLGSITILILYLTNAAAVFINNLNPASPNAILDAIAGFIRTLGLNVHFDSSLAQGIIRPEDIAYYFFMIIACLFITTRIVETRRWRG